MVINGNVCRKLKSYSGGLERRVGLYWFPAHTARRVRLVEVEAKCGTLIKVE